MILSFESCLLLPLWKVSFETRKWKKIWFRAFGRYWKVGGQNPKVGGQKPDFCQNLSILDQFCSIFMKSGGAIDPPAPLLPKALTYHEYHTMKFYDSQHTNLHARHKWTSMCHFESCFHKEASQGGQFWARILSSFHSPVMQQIFPSF